jgi:LysR family transcriptional regulator, carnitine catabolism transcriptional activator
VLLNGYEFSTRMPAPTVIYFPIESHRLHVFYAVAEAGSVAQAARLLCLTRSALSHALKSLEEDLGCTLFHRSARNLVISEAGQRLLPQAQKILEAMQVARSSVSSEAS